MSTNTNTTTTATSTSTSSVSSIPSSMSSAGTSPVNAAAFPGEDAGDASNQDLTNPRVVTPRRRNASSPTSAATTVRAEADAPHFSLQSLREDGDPGDAPCAQLQPKPPPPRRPTAAALATTPRAPTDSPNCQSAVRLRQYRDEHGSGGPPESHDETLITAGVPVLRFSLLRGLPQRASAHSTPDTLPHTPNFTRGPPSNAFEEQQANSVVSPVQPTPSPLRPADLSSRGFPSTEGSPGSPPPRRHSCSDSTEHAVDQADVGEVSTPKDLTHLDAQIDLSPVGVPQVHNWDIVHDENMVVTRVGPYETFETLGFGQAGTAYMMIAAGDNDVSPLPETVVAKVQTRMNTVYTADGSAPREAWAMARLDGHPNVVQLVAYVEYPAGNNPQWVALVMRALREAKTLSAELQTDTLSPPNAQALAGDMLAALAACERQRIVHGDVKPDNVLFVGGADDAVPQFTLIDFGAAHLHRRSAPLSLSQMDTSDLTSEERDTFTQSVADVETFTNQEIDAAKFAETHHMKDKDVELLYDSTANAFFASLDNTFSPGRVRPSAAPSPTGSTHSAHPQQDGSRSFSTPLAGALRPPNLREKSQMGAAMYQAPEITNGQLPSTASDMFALGIMLFEATCGALPIAVPNWKCKIGYCEWLKGIFGDFESIAASPTPTSSKDATGSTHAPRSTATASAPSHASEVSHSLGTPLTGETRPSNFDSASGQFSLADVPERTDQRTPPGTPVDNSTSDVSVLNMSKALEACGINSKRWNIYGSDSWLPRLLAQLLHPQSYYRGSPADLCIDRTTTSR